MKRLHLVNLIGVLLVAGLCVVQWQANRRLNLELNRLDRLNQEQADQLLRQADSAKGISADLESFRAQFIRADAEAKEHARKLATVERLVQQLERERDQLKTSVTNWAKAVADRDARFEAETARLQETVKSWEQAVAQRDERIQEANARIRQLGDELQAGVAKYNGLATNFNTTVKDYQELAARHEKLVNDWNALVAKQSDRK